MMMTFDLDVSSVTGLLADVAAAATFAAAASCYLCSFLDPSRPTST